MSFMERSLIWSANMERDGRDLSESLNNGERMERRRLIWNSANECSFPTHKIVLICLSNSGYKAEGIFLASLQYKSPGG